MAAKICPLTYALGKGAYDQEVSDFDYCVKEQCAWWMEYYKEKKLIRSGCAICFIADQKLLK